MVGWFLHMPLLFRWMPGGSAMVVITAVGLLSLNASLLAHLGNRRWISEILATVVLLIGIICLTQIILGTDLKIDQLLWSYDRKDFSGPPGRIAVPSACSLIFISLGILTLRKYRTGAGAVFAASLASGAIALITLAFISNMLGLEAGTLAGMALPSIVAFMLLSVALLVEIWHKTPRLDWSLPLSAAGLVVFTTISASMFAANNQLIEGQKWVEHTLMVRDRLNELALNLEDVHLEERLYFQGGETGFLENLESSASKVQAKVAKLLVLTRDNPVQADRMGKLEKMIEADFQAQELILQHQQEGRPVEQERRDQDLASTDRRQNMRGLLKELLDEEARLLPIRAAKAKQLSRQTNIMCGLGSGGAIILLIASTWFTSRLAQQRRMTQAQLEASNQSLETELEERHRLEKVFVQARDQALEASRFKSEFLANMSHELRTPMNGIIGMTELLMKSELDEEQREMNGVVLQSADALLEIINDILDFSKIEAGRMTIHQHPFQLRQTAEDCMVLLAPRAHAKGVELIFDAPPDVPPQLLGDAGRIRQVIMNLTGNAIKFTTHGEVCVRVMTLGIENGQFAFRVEVRDTGEGIPAEAQASLFQPFVQGDASTTRLHGGTGLGLAISRQLVELMGGAISFESELGMGSTFWFELVLPIASEVKQPDHVSETLVGHHILIVDDNPHNLSIVARQVAAMGAEPVCAATGAEAITALLQHADYGAVLLDWHLPDYDGSSLARHMRSLGLPKMPKLILMSSTDSNMDRSGEHLFDVQLVKPVREAQLRRCLMRLLGRPASVPDGAQSAPISQEPDLPPDGESLDLLIVEDNKANQAVLNKLLTKLGHRVTIAENGEVCLRLLETKGYDCIFMDCQMPVMDGYEATERIRSGSSPGANPKIPIVALTANALPAERLKCLAVGMDDFITKPVRIKDLADVIQRCGARISAVQ